MGFPYDVGLTRIIPPHAPFLQQGALVIMGRGGVLLVGRGDYKRVVLKSMPPLGTGLLGRPRGCLIFSLMALIGDPIY